MIQFRCSQCGEQLEAPESMVHDRLQCPNCRYPEPVPEPDAEEPISLEGSDDAADKDDALNIQSFEVQKKWQEPDYQRPLIKTESGATRVRTFHTKLSDNAMHHMDEVINEWIDENPNIVVKFVKMAVGDVEGKKTEPHLIVSVWY